ncbi:diguanylate cyclase (GGDEF)-like protein [Duganella sp. 1224]|uniref:ligand-binding sensor domain-containing diguanylate cyclase n=1 Tax=Duganella sp. 1224 TaxID=2587052 RepID=UPI0015CD2CA7|nr:ligand-binding sensor domain-containing diguanylate cyclase [Duganella sp. 1224]NYE63902.1 diguanylate cyclase (GGDEF)-like protein [Duganella sp. 1224]
MLQSNADPSPALLARRARVAATLCLMLSLLSLLSLLSPLAPARAESAATAAQAERWAGMSHTSFKHTVHADLGSGLCFAQDRHGFLWIGTQAGLVRWDGNRPLKYVADAREDALPDNYIISLHLDSQGRLWAGMNSGGLARYDAGRDKFVRYRASPTGLRDPRVAAMADDGQGGLWIATGSGLDHLGADGRFTRLGDAYGAATLPDSGIDALLRDADGALWAGTRRGLFRLRRDQPAQAIPLGGKAGLPINSLLHDSAGRLWIGSRNNGAFVLAPGAAAATAVAESGPQPTLHNERISSIVEAAPGEIWFGTDGGTGGIVILDVARHSTRRIRHRSDTPDSLADNDVLAMFRERSGIIYTANMVGISQHAPQPPAVATIRHLAPGRGGQLSVTSVMDAADGKLWLSMISGGVELIDPHHGYSGQLAANAGLPPGRVLTSVAGPDGETYLGTQHGLFRIDAGQSRARHITLPPRDEEEVWALAIRGRTLWMGGMDGLWGFELPADGPLRLLRHEGKSLGDPRVTTVLAAGDDVWVGTRTGLARLAPDAVEVIPTDLSTPDRLPPGYVSSLLIDRQGRLWLSNFGTGIVILERTDADGRRRFRRLGIRQGLPDSGANKLLQDQQGMVWASTDAGLARIDPRTLAILPLGPGEGVQVGTYWANSGAVTGAGELVFGGLSGLTVVRPQALSGWHYQPPMAVTRILLNDKEIPVGPYNAGLGAKAPPLTVSTAARERGFSVEFAALDYSAPERNRYTYQLKGFDHHWVQTEASSRRASYNNLPPGDYVLQLRGSNRNGDWAEALEVPVRVLPAWHQQPLARVAMVALALAAGAGLIQARTAYLRRRQRELEAMVEARTAELRATQAQLETLAYGDPLTGLANRRLFTDDLRRLVAQGERGGGACALLLVDLDHFKPVNDTHGHDAGDALLAATAERLRAAVREADRAFRLGGDEFAVLLSQPADSAALAPVCARILANLAAPLPHGDAVIQISASIGAAIYRDGDSHEQLYKRADLALYAAKAAGRNTWHLSP